MKKVLTGFAVLSVVLAAAIFALSQLNIINDFAMFTWATFGLMTLIGVLALLIGNAYAKPGKIKHFPNIIMLLIGGKMMVALLFVYGYKTLYEPTGKAFIIPFFAMYAIYTCYMCYGLIKLQKSVPTITR